MDTFGRSSNRWRRRCLLENGLEDSQRKEKHSHGNEGNLMGAERRTAKMSDRVLDMG